MIRMGSVMVVETEDTLVDDHSTSLVTNSRDEILLYYKHFSPHFASSFSSLFFLSFLPELNSEPWQDCSQEQRHLGGEVRALVAR